jgi:hypothetical protein
MSDAASTKIALTDHDLTSEGIKFLKKSKVSSNTVKDFILACLSEIESDNKQVKETRVGHYKDIEEPALEYLRIVFVIVGVNRKDVLDYENMFFTNHHETIVKHVLLGSGNAKDEQIIAFSQKIMVWFDLAE